MALAHSEVPAARRPGRIWTVRVTGHSDRSASVVCSAACRMPSRSRDVAALRRFAEAHAAAHAKAATVRGDASCQCRVQQCSAHPGTRVLCGGTVLLVLRHNPAVGRVWTLAEVCERCAPLMTHARVVARATPRPPAPPHPAPEPQRPTGPPTARLAPRRPITARGGVEQSGAERPGAKRPGAERPAPRRSGVERPGEERPGAERSAPQSSAPRRSTTERSAASRTAAERRSVEHPSAERSSVDVPAPVRPPARQPAAPRQAAPRPGPQPAAGAPLPGGFTTPPAAVPQRRERRT
ncbi:hypothetical protein QFZ63_006740 [Streptomyces sp. B3I7]|uniref:hypothetical protein n=1 Tax=Streptomyces sp. B3I7 TaxID=3042269 RepID=UPI002788A636|nr:hypothetical protein [Streptomyces sp. B3I7]MDQ0815026.1 hypothetical protein [Streptomyces sp. B3I7]